MTEDPPGVKEVLIKLCWSGFCFVSFLIKFIVSVSAPQSRNQKRGSAVMSAIEVWCRMTLRTVSFFWFQSAFFFYIFTIVTLIMLLMNLEESTKKHSFHVVVSEEQCLYQIYVDELYGGLQKPNEDEKKKYELVYQYLKHMWLKVHSVRRITSSFFHC